MARNNRKGKGAGPTLRTLKQKKHAGMIRQENRRRDHAGKTAAAAGRS